MKHEALKIDEKSVVGIIGGTGEIGYILTDLFMNQRVKEIRIFSRSEKRQYEMWEYFHEKYPMKVTKLTFYIGDVCDDEPIVDMLAGVDYLIIAASLKQVPTCESFPIEAYRVNVIGTYNAIRNAVKQNVKKCICISSDKSVYPINSMGYSKAMMESIAKAEARRVDNNCNTEIVIARFSNTMFANGTVLAIFEKQIKSKSALTLTNPDMTRFFITKKEIANIVTYCIEEASNGEVIIPKEKAVSIRTLADAAQKIWGQTETTIIGNRAGEKYFESLITGEEALTAYERDDYIVIPNLEGNGFEKYVSEGIICDSNCKSYDSRDAVKLEREQVIDLVRELEGVGMAGESVTQWLRTK